MKNFGYSLFAALMISISGQSHSTIIFPEPARGQCTMKDGVWNTRSTCMMPKYGSASNTENAASCCELGQNGAIVRDGQVRHRNQNQSQN